MYIPVVDIFAGPGGLGEGFDSYRNNKSTRIFKIILSVEKEQHAHQTLLLRSFYRQFSRNEVPDEYYKCLRGEITSGELFKIYKREADTATQEAWKAELGFEPEDTVDAKIRDIISGKKKWVLVGGPPCQAYSIVGRSRVNGINPDDPRVYLYREYYRILAVHSPPVFVMENVKGLLSAEIKENKIFHQILTDLSDPVKAYTELNGKEARELDCSGYRIYSLVKKPTAYDLYDNPVFGFNDFVIKSEEYGIPQARHRIILIGIRKDINTEPDVLKKVGAVNIRQIIKDLPRLRSGVSDYDDSETNWRKALESILSDRILNDCDENILTKIKNFIKDISIPREGRGGEFVECDAKIEYRPRWFLDSRIKGVCNHSTRGHMESDIRRYLYASYYGKIYKRSPKLKDFPVSLLPDHKNANEAVEDGKFSDRFRVQLYNEPARTITSHIAKDGHYYIHPDPTQCRSLTVREAARIQTFPDNYYFCGPRTAQYIQVGNAVPPLLAKHIAEIVYKVLQ